MSVKLFSRIYDTVGSELMVLLKKGDAAEGIKMNGQKGS